MAALRSLRVAIIGAGAAAIIGGSKDPRRFPCHEEVLRYIQEFARRFDLYGLIRFRTKVLLLNHNHLDKHKHKQQWIVRCRNEEEEEEEEEEYEEEFDAVVVCNGHYTEPRFAHIPGRTGIDSWPGKQMHSHRYRVPDPFLNQVVVIIGAKNSGGDISRDIAPVAKEVHMADRAAPARKMLPGYQNLWLRSMVDRAEEDGTVVFRDGGGSVKADVIMHCTGYKYRFPFLLSDNDDSAVVTVDDNRVHPLYKHVFPPRLAPTLSFIGLPFKVIPFPLFQLQSNWVAGVLSGRIQLPSQHQMMQDVTALYSELEAMGWPKRHTHCLKHNQFEYDDWLADQCGYSKVEEWRKHMYDAVSEKKKLCPETYRDEWDDHHLLQQANHHFQKYL
ncbi:hypothetical protein PR202_gb18281 [Eleusine coracana subsp. coracana]|uniref:Flavin-containing monooxygenase n=1 Tax=Eleusine coracana subsp. coracana TaxID=191504 RepID=A0AAV5F5U4_ELECO|nr:hypothetical protein PR202_gb18281 [Eleusine coracana subsp. coracana]